MSVKVKEIKNTCWKDCENTGCKLQAQTAVTPAKEASVVHLWAWGVLNEIYDSYKNQICWI